MATGDTTGRMREAWKMYSDQLTHFMSLGDDRSPDHVQGAKDLLGIRFMQLHKAMHDVINLGFDPETILQEKS